MGWDVGDPIGTGDDIGAPEVPFMSYGPSPEESEEERRKREERIKIEGLNGRAFMVSYEAWKLYDEERCDEALIFIDRALELCEDIEVSWNRKAIILDHMNRFEEALSCYDRAIKLRPAQVFKRNKARCLLNYCYHLKDMENYGLGLDRIEMALEIFQGLEDRKYEDEAWNLKGIFLEMSNDIPSAFNCYKRALEISPADSDIKETYKQNRDNLLQFIGNVDITCPNCGNELKITDSFCQECGANIGESIEPVLKNKPDSNKERDMASENSCVSQETIRSWFMNE